ncbi:GNAT family N-acetyltransferase [Pullulanibacillus sp. KACC 23026]|uniref:GNAT family N-acetyltransferase n=1 Tax=Pullulanibacillus sp. KACC 23026 TaxID=3028315 RepID=UPI0023AF9915|nr:GNAT family N-acetyltransferase [Pullulanibacillus sp. KACC 23026]WEG14570.1 GNAT family N-acetyltransferase [Pullulanibacillus sp. KACC 23026]
MLRDATESDVPEILEIYNDAIIHTTAVYTYEPETLENRLDWFRDRRENSYPVVVLEDGGKIRGFATYGAFRPKPAYKYSIEHSVYVHKEYRGKGAGKLLMREVIKRAEASGYATLIAAIDATNQESIALHQKLGFYHSGTIRRAGFKFGKWLDLAYYQLDLVGPVEPIEGK